MRDILSLTGGQPLAGQIRSRRICPSLAAFLQLELFRVYTLSTAGRHQPGCSPLSQPSHTSRARIYDDTLCSFSESITSCSVNNGVDCEKE
ncbi:hypothetical protein DDT56_16510 [Brenneria corticis]|uniref:Uncharacterized protein n=1 Tax=Brenneria corticis TaxID=2173106 RepID=A0A2U1TUF8_9GAMM|nr:hypothetical protein DDT56_16510 [Brenneria sp. CFCC 11842]